MLKAQCSMWRRPSKKRVTFSPHMADAVAEQSVFLKQCVSPPHPTSGMGAQTYQWRKDAKRTWSAEFFRGLGNKASRVLRRLSLSTRRSSVNKVSSSSLANLARSRSVADHKAMLDLHRAEAIEDCIEFLNSSASLQRSTSVSACC